MFKRRLSRRSLNVGGTTGTGTGTSSTTNTGGAGVNNTYTYTYTPYTHSRSVDQGQHGGNNNNNNTINSGGGGVSSTVSNLIFHTNNNNNNNDVYSDISSDHGMMINENSLIGQPQQLNSSLHPAKPIIQRRQQNLQQQQQTQQNSVVVVQESVIVDLDEYNTDSVNGSKCTTSGSSNGNTRNSRSTVTATATAIGAGAASMKSTSTASRTNSKNTATSIANNNNNNNNNSNNNNDDNNSNLISYQQQEQQLSSVSQKRPIQVQPKRSVVFNDVQVREFERILGDNPSCSSGAPISIGWGFGNERIFDIDHYEERKLLVIAQRNGGGGGRYSNNPQNRAYRSSLLLTRQAREELLLEWGTSFHDIINAIRTNGKVKNQRRRTVNAIGTYDRFEEVMENASRKIKRTLLLKNKISNSSQSTMIISQQQQQQSPHHLHHQKKIMIVNQNNKKQTEQKLGTMGDNRQVRKSIINGQHVSTSTNVVQTNYQNATDSQSGSRNSKSSNGSSSNQHTTSNNSNSNQKQQQQQSIDRFASAPTNSGTGPTKDRNQVSRRSGQTNNNSGKTNNYNNTSVKETVAIAPITEIHVSSNHHPHNVSDSNIKYNQQEQNQYNQQNYQQHQQQHHHGPAVNNYGPMNTYNHFNDDVDEDITIGSQDFISGPITNNNNENTTEMMNQFCMRALNDPNFVQKFDDRGGFFIVGDDDNNNFIIDDVDGLTSCTPLSEFTYPLDDDYNDDDDDDDDDNDDDEFEELDRDNSYWEILSSGQDYAAISRKVHPIIISETDDIVLDNGWAIAAAFNK